MQAGEDKEEIDGCLIEESLDEVDRCVGAAQQALIEKRKLLQARKAYERKQIQKRKRQPLQMDRKTTAKALKMAEIVEETEEDDCSNSDLAQSINLQPEAPPAETII